MFFLYIICFYLVRNEIKWKKVEKKNPGTNISMVVYLITVHFFIF